MRNLCLWIAWGMALSGSGLARAEFTPERIYEEVVDPPTPVSGQAVVGVAMVPSEQAAKSDRLWVRVNPKRAPTIIRVDVVSANGRLRGEGTWRFKPKEPAREPKEPEGDWYEVTVPPKAPRPAKPEQLAWAVQAVSPGASGAARPAFLLAAQGNKAPAAQPKVQVRLFVNTRRGELFVYQPGQANPVRCVPVADTQTIRFDAVCDVTLALDENDEKRDAILTLVRRDGQQTSRQQIELLW